MNSNAVKGEGQRKSKQNISTQRLVALFPSLELVE